MKTVIDNYQNNITKFEKSLLGGRPLNKKYKNMIRWNISDPSMELSFWTRIKILFGCAKDESEQLLIEKNKKDDKKVNISKIKVDEVSKEKIKSFLDNVNINMDESEFTIMQK